jgi:transposase
MVDDCDYKVVSLAAGSPRVRKNHMHPTPSLGIDIAQLSFDAALRLDEERWLKARFDNRPAGFRKLQRWLQTHGVGPLRVGVESTNVYADALAHWLHAAGHQVYLLNPERTAYYARSQGQRNKTDPADALSIAHFIARHHDLTPWQPPSPEHKHLRSLTRVRAQLVLARTQLRHQLATADAVARPHLRALERALREQLARIGREIAQHLRLHPLLGEQVRRCMTLKGIGLVTAAVVVAELPPVTAQTDPRALCAWVGLTPRRWQSGQTEGRARLSRKGNAHLRLALYMPALVAKRCNPLLRAFALRLAANGKSTGAILGALAHKMLRILVGLLRSQTDFDPNWSCQKS